MPTPVVYIHGPWLHATSWTRWVDLFADAGYAPVASGRPGDGDTVEKSLTADQFRFAFDNAIPEQESQTLFDRWTTPAPGKPPFQAAAANFNPHSPPKSPHRKRAARAATAHDQLMTGGKDHTVPEASPAPRSRSTGTPTRSPT